MGALTLYVDISGLFDGTLPEPPAPAPLRRSDGHKLFYAGQVNLVFGDPESGKTWICLAAATEAVKDGRRVLVVDLDHNGAEATVHRLLALGAPDDRLRDAAMFRYCEPEDRTELRRVVKDTKSGGQRLRSLTALANCSRCAARTPTTATSSPPCTPTC